MPAPAPRHDLEVVAYDESRRQPWDDYVLRHPRGRFAHLRKWADVIGESFGHQCRSLIAMRRGEIHGVLPLFLVRSAIFGRSLVSAPGANAAGVLAADDGVERALVGAASDLVAALRVSYAEIRQEAHAAAGLACKSTYVTTVLRLEPDAAAVKARVSTKIRRDLARARRDGLALECGASQLEELHDRYRRHMHRLGSPAFGLSFFASIARSFDEETDVVVARRDGRVVAGIIAVRHQGRVSNLWAGAEPAALRSGAISTMCWDQIERACRRGDEAYDLGRSTRGSSAHRYKAHWKGEDVDLPYGYLLASGVGIPEREAGSARFRLAASVWRHLPAPVVDRLGPALMSALH
jgi:FemAB-related protein (PEP-CTERM system-associated)